MDTDERKFERTREKFRRNMRREQERRSQTIYLSDDELPGPSRGRRKNQRKRQPKKDTHTATTRQPPSTANRKAAPKTCHLRMTTTTTRVPIDTSRHEHPTPAASSVTPSNDTGEEEAPPPPAFVAPEEDVVEMVKTPSPLLSYEYLETDDLHSVYEDLADPLMQEFARTFCGAEDTTVDRPSPHQPSPPSSFSSLDWENENYHPPTPPRRKIYGTFDIYDQQYYNAGMKCYERNWRARILVPQRNMPPLHALPPSSPARKKRDDPPDDVIDLTWEPPTEQTLGSNQTTPVTLERERLRSLVKVNTRPTDEVNKSKPKAAAQTLSPDESPTPSPPSLLRNESPVPPPPALHLYPMDKTPVPTPIRNELQEIIAEKRARHPGERLRFSHIIGDTRYRVTVNRDGTTQISQIGPTT